MAKKSKTHTKAPKVRKATFKAPQVVAIDPGHDGWVVGKDLVVLIEFDFEGDTISRLGMPAEHGH